MPGDSDPLRAFLDHLGGYHQLAGQPAEATRNGHLEPPEHWLSQRVKLQYDGRSVVATVPSFMCRQVGVDPSYPPEVSVYFDPVMKLVMYDLADNFEEVSADG